MLDNRASTAPGKPIVIRSDHDPIDLIAEDHWRQRAMLAELAALTASSAVSPHRLAPVLDWLRAELAVHRIDEDDDLLPLLRRRAEPEDDVDGMIERLRGEPEATAAGLPDVLEALDQVGLHSAPLSPEARAAIAAWVACELRRLIFENAVVLPLARTRLTVSDRRSLALRMAARRGYCLWPREH